MKVHSFTSPTVQSEPKLPCNVRLESYQPLEDIYQPEPCNDPNADKMQAVILIGLAGACAGLVAGSFPGEAGAIAGGLAGGAFGATGGAFAGLSIDLRNLGNSNVTPWAAGLGAAVGVAAGALLGAGTTSGLATALFAVAGAAGGGLGANMVIDPAWS